jgi:UDP-N-acetylmuramate: L-alanyl-gamma-D-glutamyl-meso-diaminopimelate ligase
LPQAIGEFIIADREAVVVSGTHGKTTTTALTAWLISGFESPLGFLVGGIPKNFSQSFQNPSGKYFVIEGDEYDTAFFDKVPKFIHYRPRHVILTSVEFDHADIYKDLSAVEAAFFKLAEMIPPKGNLFFWADDKTVSKIAATSKAACFGYGIEKGDYIASIQDVSEQGIRFDVKFKGKSIAPDDKLFTMRMSGTYNVLNATASLALCHQLGFDMKIVASRLQEFTGVKRRQEVLGEPGGVLVIEDFAHHPTAVRETIIGIQKKYPGKKFFSVFEPRSATSRRKVFQQDYVNAFTSAQEILIASAFDQSKIDAENRFSSQELVQDLVAKGKAAYCYENVEEIVNAIAKRARPGDGVLIMSNGGFDGIYTKILNALEKSHA